MKHPPENFVRGALVGGNADAEEQDLIRDRGVGTITSQRPMKGCVCVHWENGRRERWHVDLLEIIDSEKTSNQ